MVVYRHTDPHQAAPHPQDAVLLVQAGYALSFCKEGQDDWYVCICQSINCTLSKWSACQRSVLWFTQSLLHEFLVTTNFEIWPPNLQIQAHILAPKNRILAPTPMFW